MSSGPVSRVNIRKTLPFVSGFTVKAAVCLISVGSRQLRDRGGRRRLRLAPERMKATVYGKSRDALGQSLLVRT
jgi:hypothetical protein